jgi:predicted secreted protein
MGNPTHAFGTTFAWNGQTVAGLTAINGVKLTADMIDVTTHQSANGYREYLPGLRTAGSISLEGQYDNTDSNGQIAMVTDFNTVPAPLRTAIITFPTTTGTTWTFTGYIEDLEIGNATLDGKIPFTASIKPTGRPALAVATSAGLTTPFFTVSNSGVIVPTAAQATLEYTINWLTGVTSFTITPTAAAGVITVTANGASQVVTSGNASSAIALGSAGSMINMTVVVQETNKSPKTYLMHCVRA